LFDSWSDRNNAKTLNPFIYVTIYFHEYSQRSVLTDWRSYHLPSQWAVLYATIAKRFVYSRPTPLSPIVGAPTYRSDFTVGTSPAIPNAVSPLVQTATSSLALVPTAPSHFFRQYSTRLSDVTTARVPDTQEFTMEGLSSALPPMNIRGHYSYTVDGICDNHTTAAPCLENAGVSRRFIDLVPEEIESVEVIRSHSGSIVYGTDATNGVISVTTNRGATGGPNWSFYTDGGPGLTASICLPDNRCRWGHPAHPSHANLEWSLSVELPESCTHVDVTEFNPLRDPIPTSFAVGHHFVSSSQVMDGVSSASRFLLRPRPAACCSPKNAERRSPARGDIAGSTRVRLRNTISRADENTSPRVFG
jgi:hypothetical protein